MGPTAQDLPDRAGTIYGPAGVFNAPVSVSVNGRPIVAWPHLVGVVPALADCRVDRPVDADLEIAVGAGDGTVVVCQVLAGLGGVGKTQLAASLAHRWWSGRRLDLLVWVSATSRAQVITRYAQAAADVTGVQDREPSEGAARFLAWLAATSARWLIVLDDLTDPGDLAGLWPPATVTGQVVVTTRRRDAALLAGRHLIDVDLFTSQEAIGYLRAKLGDAPKRLIEAEALAADLGYLPLALTQAAAYILDQTGLTCADYRLRLSRRPLADLAPHALPDDHRTPVAGAWELSIDLADHYADGLARPVLQLAAVLDPNAIPVEMFSAAAVLDYCAGRAGRVVDADDVLDTVRLLHRLSLATIDGAGDTVRMHGLLQRLTRETTPSDLQPDLAVAAANAVLQLWPDIERDAPFAHLLRTNALALRATSGTHLCNPDGVHPIVFRIGQSLGAAGSVSAARDYFQQLTVTVDQHLGPGHPDTLVARYCLARSLGAAGDPADAAAALRALLDELLGGPFFEEWFPSFDPGAPGGSIGMLDDWVRALEDRLESIIHRRPGTPRGSWPTGWDQAAAVALREVLDELLQQLAGMQSDPPGTHAVHEFAAAYDDEDQDLDTVTAAFQRMVDDMSRTLGPDHPFIPVARDHLDRAQAAEDPADHLTTLLALLTATVDYVVAYLKALLTLSMMFAFAPVIFMAWLSFVKLEVHSATILIIRGELARWLAEVESPAAAIVVLQAVADDMEQALGTDHLATLTARGTLAHMQGLAGDPAAATASYQALLADRLRVLGPDHPTTLTTMANLARWWGEAGNPASAITALRAVVDDMRRVVGPDHPATLTARGILAHMRSRAEGPASASAAYQRLLSDQLRVLGPNHPDTLNTRHELAFRQGEAGDPAGAVAALRQVLADYSRAVSPNHPNTLTIRDNIAYWEARATQEPSEDET